MPHDDQKGRYLDFEVGVVQPLIASVDGTELVALNQAGNRLVFLDAATLDVSLEVPIGLGAASVALRPGRNEYWVVDRVASAVTVVDGDRATITRTIRVGAEPHGIAFTASGDRAYVTCSGVDRVDVLRTSDYTVVKSLAIPAKSPRGIVVLGTHAWLVPLLSGNNTAPRGTLADPYDARTVEAVTGPGITPLPDRDLLAIQISATPEGDALVPALTRTGLGTTLFNVHVRPGTSELWIPNTDALNATHRGEKNFIAGQVVRNRLTIVDTSGNQPPRIVDLDQLAPSDVKCAQPTGLAFDPVRARVYVCGYGSDLVAVLDILPDQSLRWAGAVTLPPKQSYPRGTQPRAALASPDGHWLWVFNKNDSSITKVDLTTLPTSMRFVTVAPLPRGLGFEATSTEESLGRNLFNDARFSLSKTSSCASCHIDGLTDGLVWDLSDYLDPEGTANSALTFGLDVKGPMLTQSVRRMEESGPYHWRGERRSLNDFANTFATLLEHQTNGVPSNIGPDFQYLRHYINRLAYPANARQNLDRSLTADQAAGAEIFLTKPVLGSLTCSSCHTLPLGTRGEVIAETPAGVIHSADVPQLRGLSDRATPSLAVGGSFGSRTELGAGFTHAGAFDSVRSVILQPSRTHLGETKFDVTPLEATQVVAFLEAFDTGLAPSTAYQATAHPGNSTKFAAGDLAYLTRQAKLGNCDVVFFRSPPGPLRAAALGIRALTGQYDPASERFWLCEKGASLSEAELLAEAASGHPVTFLGVPLGMGASKGLDRDMDDLYDFDEMQAGTSPDDTDTDSDRLPDGYELRWGSDPLVHNPTIATADTTPPQLAGPARLIYATTNTLKFEFDVSEYSRIHISYNGGYVVQRLPLDHQGDTRHWVVLGDLEPGTTYQITLLIKDPSGNTATDSTTVFQTAPRLLGSPTHIDMIQLAVAPLATPTLVAQVGLKVNGAPPPPNYRVLGSVYRRTAAGTFQMVAASVEALSGLAGRATFQVPLPTPAGAAGTVYFVVKDIFPPVNAPAYVLAANNENFDTITY